MVPISAIRTMSTRTSSYLDAIEHLPGDAVLVFHDVTWSEYEHLTTDMGEAWPSMRVTYNKGRLQIVSASSKHEMIKTFVDNLVAAFCDEKAIVMENLGGTGFKRERAEHGVEPDVCFYVTNIAHVVGLDEMDPDVVPPPDVVVEIDITNSSTVKFEIYAAFAVPEIWRYFRQRLHMYRLAGKDYVEISSSIAFPGLTAEIVTRFIEQSRREGRTPTLAAFRQWARGTRA